MQPKKAKPKETISRLSGIPKILMIEDHPLTAKGYELILKKAIKAKVLPTFSFVKANSLESAYHFLEKERTSFAVVFLDICMPPFERKKMFSGEDLGKWIKKKYPKTKITIITGILDLHRLQGILSSINPSGFILKTELDEMILIQSIRKGLDRIPYYSPSILKLIKNQYLSGISLNTEQKEFLFLLSKGIPSKEIPNYLPWSLSKVEKQKRILREKLNADHTNVLALVYKAKELGII